MLGQRLVEYTPAGFQVIATDLSPEHQFIAEKRYRSCDITNRDALIDLVEKVKPKHIINTAAYTNVDGAEDERDLCWLVNVIAMENLVYAARRVHASIYHVSSDYIFNGADGPYKEANTPNPIGFYGQSKLGAEQVLKGSPLNYTIARTMVLYGVSENERADFVGWIIKKLRNREAVHIVTDQVGNTTFSDDLARALWELVRINYHGIVNVAGREIISRYDFALRIAKIFNLDESLIKPITTADLKQRAPRPLNSGLIVDKALATLGIELSSVDEGLVKYKALLGELDS